MYCVRYMRYIKGDDDTATSCSRNNNVQETYKPKHLLSFKRLVSDSIELRGPPVGFRCEHTGCGVDLLTSHGPRTSLSVFLSVSRGSKVQQLPAVGPLLQVICSALRIYKALHRDPQHPLSISFFLSLSLSHAHRNT